MIKLKTLSIVGGRSVIRYRAHHDTFLLLTTLNFHFQFFIELKKKISKTLNL
jgi:hypothetical protein